MRDSNALPFATVRVDAVHDNDGEVQLAIESTLATDRAQQRMHHLFRHALSNGEVNPLLHLLLRRQGGSA